MSRWTKKDILEGIEEAYDDEDVKAAAKKLALSDLKRIFLICSGWHHTSKYYNCTDFYSVDDSICLADISDYLADKRAGESAIKLLAKREKWLKSHAWHVQHAVWTDSRGKCTDSGKVQKSGAFFADHAEEAVKAELDRRLAPAGVAVEDARLTHLAYAPEIAQAMLRRQQADAILAARKKIVEGAVSMVEMAVDRLSAGGAIELDDERKAAMAQNLMVVLCGESDAQPVLNTGSLYA